MLKRKAGRASGRAIVLVAAGFAFSGAVAQEGDQNAETSASSGTLPSIARSLPYGGDPTGSRAFLASRGIQYNAIYTGEVFSNRTGGLRRGTIYEGKFELNTTWDLEKLTGVKGLSFFGNMFQIHNTGGISKDYVGALQTVSAIEARPTTRLSELWLEQKFFDGAFGLRVGQLAADAEFFISTYSLPFINSDFPAISKQNLPGTGPAYPLATPGIRARFDPNPNASFLLAVFNGNPAGPGDDAEKANRNGINFRLKDPALIWAETQFRWNQGVEDTGLAGILRFGAWTHLGSFNDQHYDRGGLSLASPLGNGVPNRLRGNQQIYGIIDQQIWRPEGGDPNSGITVFSRIGGGPSDRNLIDFYLDGGVVFSGLVPGRPNDKFGVTALYSHLSSDGRALDRELVALGLARTMRSYELALEATYVAEIVPGWSVQPDLQYVFRPGGGVPLDPTSRALKNATILGLRTTIVY